MVLKELIFNSFYIGQGVMVLKELIFNIFYIEQGVVVLKASEDLTIDTVCRCGVPERTESTDLILPQ